MVRVCTGYVYTVFRRLHMATTTHELQTTIRHARRATAAAAAPRRAPAKTVVLRSVKTQYPRGSRLATTVLESSQVSDQSRQSHPVAVESKAVDASAVDSAKLLQQKQEYSKKG